MDPKRFDRLARTLAATRIGRRGVAGAVLGVGGLAAAYRLMFAQPACAGDGQSCTIMGGCCDGLVCGVSMMNPNFGTCRAGEDILGTGWTFAGMEALPAVATEIARERRRKKGRNKKRNSNKRNRQTPTPTSVPQSTPVGTQSPATQTPSATGTPTISPTMDPNATPPTQADVDLDLKLDCALDSLNRPESTKITNIGRTPITVTIVNGSSGVCYQPNLAVGVNETVDFKSGPGTNYETFLFAGDNPYVSVQVAYVAAPGVTPDYVSFRAFCRRNGTERLADPRLCRRN